LTFYKFTDIFSKMEKLRNNRFVFEENIIRGFENLEKYYDALIDPNTKIFWDMDLVLIDSGKTVFNEFNNKNPYKIKANLWESDRFDYLNYLVEKMGIKDETDWESDWYKNIPLYKSKAYKYSKMALDISLDLTGAENNYILTSRLPRLKRATDLCVRREFPEFKIDNLLIRNKSSEEKADVYKVDCLKKKASRDHFTILIEDHQPYIELAIKSNIPNFMAIGIPFGANSFSIEDDNLMTLARYPFCEQETRPLYSLFLNALKKKSKLIFYEKHL